MAKVGLFDVTTRDIRRVQRELKEFAPDLRKNMDRDVKRIVAPVIAKAKNNMPARPLSRWPDDPNARYGPQGRFPGYEQSAARRGIRLATGSSRKRIVGGQKQTEILAYALVQGSAGGAVYEVAGRRTGGKNTFVRNLRRKNGAASRGIWRAWDQTNAKETIASEADAVIRRTIREYNQRLAEKS